VGGCRGALAPSPSPQMQGVGWGGGSGVTKQNKNRVWVIRGIANSNKQEGCGTEGWPQEIMGGAHMHPSRRASIKESAIACESITAGRNMRKVLKHQQNISSSPPSPPHLPLTSIGRCWVPRSKCGVSPNGVISPLRAFGPRGRQGWGIICALACACLWMSETTPPRPTHPTRITCSSLRQVPSAITIRNKPNN